MRVTLHHPELGQIVEVDERQVATMRKAGWEGLDEVEPPRPSADLVEAPPVIAPIAPPEPEREIFSATHPAEHGDEEDSDR